MARLRYYPTPADFAIGFGESVPLLDADGVTPLPGDPVGRVAAVPEASASFQVCTTADIADVTTDLLVGGLPATTWDTSTDFVTLGRGPIMEGPDLHEGPLFLTADAGVTFYRIEPDSTDLYTRAAALKAFRALFDESEWPPADGETWVWNDDLGTFVTAAAAGTGTVTSAAGVAPVAGDIPAEDLKSALGAADAAALAAHIALIQTRSYILCRPLSGGGYEAKPSGFQLAIRPGAEQPSSQLADYDIWLQPADS